VAQKTISEAEQQKTLEAMRKYKKADGSYDFYKIADALGIHKVTAHRRVHFLTNKMKDRDSLRRFSAPSLPHRSRQIEELIQDRLVESKRVIEADEARELIDIKVNIDGPYGLLIFGDPHIDDPGCAFHLLKSHIELAQQHPHILACNIGDLANNWVGRLARLYADQSVTARESWTLVEWMVKSVNWLFIIAGNHDLWAGSGDPVAWFTKQVGSLYEDHGVRLALKQPCGVVTRIHARHDFPGHSIWNSMHGPKRELITGFRDHILVAGHRHIGGDEGTISPDGICAQLVRVSGYKLADTYARTLGLKKMPIHPAALVIVDPREPDNSRGRAWCAPTVEIGVKMLNAIRADYEQKGSGLARRGRK